MATLLGLTLITSIYAQNGPDKIYLGQGEYKIEQIVSILENEFGQEVSHSLTTAELGGTIVLPLRSYGLEELLAEALEHNELEYSLQPGRVLIRSKQAGSQKTGVTMRGNIIDVQSGEALIGATVYVKELRDGAVSNKYGFYSLTLPTGVYVMVVAYLGYQPQVLTIELEDNTQVDFDLEQDQNVLQEVVIQADPESSTVGLESQMSAHRITGKLVKELPALVGEADVIKALQLLPGISTITEGSSGLIVRGGGRDQNLIILDEAPVYNPSHLFGFYSVFNPDAINDIQLYKGAFPAKYGGRLSSVMDVTMKEGNNRRFGISGGLGLISSRITLEGPLKKEQSSFMINGRRTYADLFMKLDPNDGGNNVYFYDFNTKWNYRINRNNRIYLSGYFGRDLLRFFNQYDANWGNTTGTLRWNHIFNDRLFSNFSFVASEYRYQLNYYSEVEQQSLLKWNSRIRDLNLKADFSWFLNPTNTIQFGFNVIDHQFNPGENPDQPNQDVPDSRGLESALYIGNDHRLGKSVFVSYGLRYSIFQNYGNGKVYHFDQDYRVVDSTEHDQGIYNTYGGFEPRINLRKNLGPNSSIKASYTRSRQYLQVLTNSSLSFTAFDIHIPVSPNVQPLVGDQFNLGYFRNIGNKVYEFSVEGYFKKMQNVVDYVDHASLIQNPFLEGEFRSGNGKSYGIETLLRKNTGRLTGWVGYTWSRAELGIPGINQGRYYRAHWDRPHDVSVVLNYKKTQKWWFSLLWVYATGNAISLPNGNFQYSGARIPIYSDRNSSRLPDYHRLDLSATIYSKKNLERRWQSSWTFTVYNAYFRVNPISLNFLARDDGNGKILEPYTVVARKTYLFGFLPSITYNFKF